VSGFRVMAAFAAGATIAGMVVGVARLTDVVEPSTAVADGEAGKAATVAIPTANPRSAATPIPTSTSNLNPTAIALKEPETKPEGWHAPEGAPEEVTAGVLARVASRRAKATGCDPARQGAAAAPKARRAGKAESCPPEDGIESIEIDWSHGSTSAR
jgi:hypothetical protein